MDEKIGGAAAIFGAITGFLYGGWNGMMTALLVLVVIDFLSGFWAAYINGELRSMKGYIGIAKKVGMFMFVTVAHVIDGVLGENHYLRDAVIFFYIANELLSIIENAGKMGVPLPPALTNAVLVLQEKAGGKGASKDESKQVQD
ncbi:holin [Paenibacillus sp. SSG-1]|uniref:phage holin family protein n=1 Tax=Paenibacillus sp. SSG-1 TaxID=1443669 RepID=UPI000B7E9E3E|nr:phage holin family protein [Paenibacillus sp. SSG-1]OXL83193.1 holin [Paenibacillus sp. SSG-1]